MTKATHALPSRRERTNDRALATPSAASPAQLGSVAAMAMRSLSGKLNGFLRARAAAASSPTAAAAAASSMIPVKRYSTEERLLAILRERQRLQDEKFRRDYEFLGVFVAACVGVVAFAASSTRKTTEESKQKHMVFEEKMAAIMGDDYAPMFSVEDVYDYFMDELHRDMMDAIPKEKRR